MQIFSNTLAFFALVLLSQACTKLQKYEFNATAGQTQFSGLTSFEESAEGKTVTWEIPDGKLADSARYSVHMVNVTDLTAVLEPARALGRLIKETETSVTNEIVMAQEILELLEDSVALGAGIVTNTFTIPPAKFEKGKSYLITAKFQSDKGEPVWGNSVYLVDFKSDPPVDVTAGDTLQDESKGEQKYDGCKAVESQNHKQVKVEFEFPEWAKRIFIYRGSQLVHVETNKANTIYIDVEGLEARTWYEYRCVSESTDGELAKVVSDFVQTDDPLAPLATLRNSFAGCANIRVLGASTVQVDGTIPAGASELRVLRDGSPLRVIQPDDAKIFNDDGLQEGREYAYRCDIVAEDAVLKGQLQTVTTFIANPPTFGGLQAATGTNAHTVRVSWLSATGTPTRRYRVYMALNDGSDIFATAPVKYVTQEEGLFADITGLGDEMSYRFAVRACADSAGTICDSNTVVMSRTLADDGAPASSGAGSVSLVNGKGIIVASWDHTKGAVAKRNVYQRIGAVGGTNIADYTKFKSVIVNSVNSVASSIEMANLAENTTYHWIVRDEDVFGNENTNTAVVTLAVGDLTAPTFGGASVLAVGSTGYEETSLRLTFQAIKVDSNDATYCGVNASNCDVNGAQDYVVYRSAGTADACGSGTEVAVLTAKNYTSGTDYDYVPNDLTPRTTYSYCIKARDAAGNKSNNTTNLTRTTLDTHAPQFDGIQSISYNAPDQKLVVKFNKSTSTDIFRYRFRMWRNTATPSSSDYSSFSCYATSDATCSLNVSEISFTRTATEFSFTDNDRVYAVVDACDTAASLIGGTENCTSFSNAQGKNILLPDTNAPAGFTGIKAANTFTNSVQGTVTVKWNAPASWNDYFGFKIYYVDTANANALTIAKSCLCVQGVNCSDQLVQCDVTGLSAYRTYCLHVRAYDAANNETIYVDPATSRSCIRTVDTASPTFVSSATADSESGVTSLAWLSASDNQYAQEAGATLTYLVYRKLGATFSNTATPWTDGNATLLYSGSNTYYADSNVTGGSQYYYEICVQDAAGNMTCDSSAIKNVYVPDQVAPTLSSVATTHTEDARIWKLTWNMTDNLTASSAMKVSLYRSATASSATATTADTAVIAEQNGSDYLVSGNSFEINNLTGELNLNRYINYLLVVKDADGNITTRTISVNAQFQVVISSVRRNSGPMTGGTAILIEGQGFQSGATVSIGGSTCSNVMVHLAGYRKLAYGAATSTGSYIGCTLGTTDSYGAVNVTVTNTEGSSTTASGGFTYCDSTVTDSSTPGYCTNICDRAPTGSATTFQSGAGTSASPHQICNKAQLNYAVRNGGTATVPKYYALADNIDLDTDGDGNGGGTPTFTVYPTAVAVDFNGQNFAIMNWTATSTEQYFGLLRLSSLTATGTYVQNLLMLNGALTCAHSYCGFVASNIAGTTWPAMKRIFATGEVRVQAGGNNFGGILGRSSGAGLDEIVSYVNMDVTAGGTRGQYVGGIAGWLQGGADLTNAYAFGNVNALQYAGAAVGAWNGSGAVASNITASGNVTSSGNFSGGVIGHLSSTGMSIDNVRSSGTHSFASFSGGVIGTLDTSSGTISNVTFSGASLQGGTELGGIAGAAATAGILTISNATVNSAITSTGEKVGGIFGSARPTASFSVCSVSGSITGTRTIGGVVGNMHVASNGAAGSIANCAVNATITYTATSSGGTVGGLVGVVSIAGGNTGSFTIQKNYFSGTISAASTAQNDIGGLVGRADVLTLSISKSFVTADLSGQNNVGGILGTAGTNGLAALSISDVFYRGNIRGGASAGTYFGGIIGRDYSAGATTISRVYSAATMQTLATSSGKVFGATCPTTVSDVFHNSTLTGPTTESCASSSTALTTTQMQTQSPNSFTNFDFATPVWTWSNGSGVYPSLYQVP
jgi:hypothetical protein